MPSTASEIDVLDLGYLHLGRLSVAGLSDEFRTITTLPLQLSPPISQIDPAI
jgi:hypothetical protein